MPEPKYVMPPARLGFALWYPDPNSKEPIPCIITAVGDRSAGLTVWAEDNRGGLPKDGVRHISDPEVPKMAGYTAGVWDYAPDTKELIRLQDQIDVMQGTVTSLVESLG